MFHVTCTNRRSWRDESHRDPHCISWSRSSIMESMSSSRCWFRTKKATPSAHNQSNDCDQIFFQTESGCISASWCHLLIKTRAHSIDPDSPSLANQWSQSEEEFIQFLQITGEHYLVQISSGTAASEWGCDTYAS